jgi:hypothetical protein
MWESLPFSACCESSDDPAGARSGEGCVDRRPDCRNRGKIDGVGVKQWSFRKADKENCVGQRQVEVGKIAAVKLASRHHDAAPA